MCVAKYVCVRTTVGRSTYEGMNRRCNTNFYSIFNNTRILLLDESSSTFFGQNSSNSDHSFDYSCVSDIKWWTQV